VATNPSYTAPEIEYQVNNAGSSILFVYDSALCQPEGRSAQDADQDHDRERDQAPKPGDLRFNDMLDGSNSAAVPVQPEDTRPAPILWRTTGLAKGAIVLHRNLVANTLQFKAWMVQLKVERRNHPSGHPDVPRLRMVCGMCLSMALGSGMVLLPNPGNIDDLLGSIQKLHPTYFPRRPDAL